jgi:hypothetical protein
MSAPAAVLVFGGVGVLARHARLFAEARSRGYAVLAVTTGGPGTGALLTGFRDDPGHPLAALTDWVVLDDAVVETVVAAVTARFADYRIAAVVSCGEIFVEACGQLADLWGLPGSGLRAARVCRNKLLQRRYLAEFSPRSVHLAAGDREAAADLVPGYPAVVKPTGRMSSSGVRRVGDAAELAAAVAAVRPGEGLLLEEVVDGPEFSVEALVRDGEVFWENVTGKLTNDAESPYFTELRHVVPAAGLDDDALAALLDANRRVLARLEFGTGITHAEFRLQPGRGPVLMEVAARVPGDGITWLLHLATGVPIEPVLLDLALGEPAAYPAVSRRAAHQYLEGPPGRLTGVRCDAGPEPVPMSAGVWPDPVPLAPSDPARTAAVFAWLDPGTVLGALRDSGDRVASVAVDLPLDADVEPVIAAAVARVRIDVAALAVR